jgi:hypothetical protein
MNILYKSRYLLWLPLLLLIAFVFSKALADYVVSSAFDYERAIVAESGGDKKQDWDNAVASIHLGMKIDPFNPNSPELLGRLHFWRFFIQDAPIESFEQAQRIVNAGLEPPHLAAVDRLEAWPLFVVCWLALS